MLTWIVLNIEDGLSTRDDIFARSAVTKLTFFSASHGVY